MGSRPLEFTRYLPVWPGTFLSNYRLPIFDPFHSCKEAEMRVKRTFATLILILILISVIFPVYKTYIKSRFVLFWFFLFLVLLPSLFGLWIPSQSPTAVPQRLPSPLLPLATWQAGDAGKPQGSVSLLLTATLCANSVTHATGSLSLPIIKCRCAGRLVIWTPIS